MSRFARVERNTKESNVLVELELDGTGVSTIDTGVPFFDHMLAQLAKHGGFDLVVNTKGDLGPRSADGSLVVSSKTGEGIDSLTKEIHRRAGIERFDFEQGYGALVAHERHAQCLLRAVDALHRAIGHDAIAMDIRAEELRVACDALDALVGRISPDDVLGEIFSRFCIGK